MPFVKLRQLTNAWRAWPAYNYSARRIRDGEKLWNPSALLYRAPGRKCDNERDSETSMRALVASLVRPFTTRERRAFALERRGGLTVVKVHNREQHLDI